MKSFKDHLNENKEVSTLNEQDYQQVKDTITKEIRRIRSNLMSDAQTISRIANAMQDHQYDKKIVKKVKDLENDMDKIRQELFKLQ